MLILWGHGSRAFQGRRARGAKHWWQSLEDLGPDVPTPTRIYSELGSLACPGHHRVRRLPDGAPDDGAARWPTSFPKALFIGSMVPEPASGWPYFDMFGTLGQKQWGPRAVASAVVEAYAASVDTDDWCLVVLDLAGS